MINLENKTFVIMGIANKRSIGFGVAKVLDELGAHLVFTYRKERSKRIRKIIRPIKSKEHHLYQIDVQKMKMSLMALRKLVKKLETLMASIIQLHLLIWKIYVVVFLKHLVKDSYLHKILVHIH